MSRSPARRHSTPSRRSSFLYLRSDRRRACTVSLNSRVRGISLLLLLRLAFLVVGPSLVRVSNVPVLPLLRPAGEQNHDGVAILAEIDAIPRPEIIRYSNTPAPTPLTFEKFPSSSRRSAVVTLAAAGASRLRNQAANGLEPARSRYSRTVKIHMVTQELPLSSTAHATDGGSAASESRPCRGCAFRSRIPA